jgi:hypothetical protein
VLANGAARHVLGRALGFHARQLKLELRLQHLQILWLHVLLLAEVYAVRFHIATVM